MALTDTQLLLLSGASQRDDRLITIPETLKGAAVKKTVAKLIGLNFAEEVAVKRDQPHWRMDEDEHPIGLKITAAGLAAIGIESEPEPAPAAQRKAAKRKSDKPAQAEQNKAAGTGAASSAAPRPGTKQALIIALLSRPEGATIDDLLSATGWLAHTTRAALTGLRQRGYEFVKSKNKAGETVYRTGPATPGAAEASRSASKRARAGGAR